MRVSPGRLTSACAAVLGLAVWGCGSAGMVLPSDTAGTELYVQAQAFLDDGKNRQAAEAFDTLLRNYPTSPHLPEARLGLGRAYYEYGRSDRLLLAVDAFRNFLTYHPSHEQVDYAQLMIAMSFSRLMRSPDRDQSQTREALRAYEEFHEDYPDSRYSELAAGNMLRVVDTLAQHEMQVAAFQLGRGRFSASRQRAHYALRNYPLTSYRCELINLLAESYWREGNARQAGDYYQRLVDEHPGCEHAGDARRRLNTGGATGSSEDGGPGIR